MDLTLLSSFAPRQMPLEDSIIGGVICWTVSVLWIFWICPAIVITAVDLVKENKKIDDETCPRASYIYYPFDETNLENVSQVVTFMAVDLFLLLLYIFMLVRIYKNNKVQDSNSQ